MLHREIVYWSRGPETSSHFTQQGVGRTIFLCTRKRGEISTHQGTMKGKKLKEMLLGRKLGEIVGSQIQPWERSPALSNLSGYSVCLVIWVERREVVVGLFWLKYLTNKDCIGEPDTYPTDIFSIQWMLQKKKKIITSINFLPSQVKIRSFSSQSHQQE